MRIQGKIVGYDGIHVIIHGDLAASDAWVLEKQEARDVEIRIPDGRELSPEQRKLIYALIGGIAEFCGSDPDWEKQLRKYHFASLTSVEPFSLSNVDMTTANRFIDYLLDVCLELCVGLNFRPIDRINNDKFAGKWLYRCLVYRTCCICGKAADIHHVDAVGAGRNREEINHVGMMAMALCREHHNEAHAMGKMAFNEKYHVFGIKLDSYLVKKLKL